MRRNAPNTPRRPAPQARRLRGGAAEARRRLWARLRDGQLAGCVFRPRHPVPPYVVGFACVAAKLAVETDGGAHRGGARAAQRDAYLRGKGWRVLHFCNRAILTDIEGVIATILCELRRGSLPTQAAEGGAMRSEMSASPPLLAGEVRSRGRGG